MTLGLILLWSAGVLLMAGLIDLWFYWDRNASHGLLQAFLLLGALFAFFTPLALALVPGAVLWGLVRLIQVETSRRRTLSSQVQPEPSPALFRRVIKWVFRLAGRAATDPVVEHLVAAHQRIHHEKEEIDRAMQANPGDPALLRRIRSSPPRSKALIAPCWDGSTDRQRRRSGLPSPSQRRRHYGDASGSATTVRSCTAWCVSASYSSW